MYNKISLSCIKIWKYKMKIAQIYKIVTLNSFIYYYYSCTNALKVASNTTAVLLFKCIIKVSTVYAQQKSFVFLEMKCVCVCVCVQLAFQFECVHFLSTNLVKIFVCLFTCRSGEVHAMCGARSWSIQINSLLRQSRVSTGSMIVCAGSC